MAIFDGLARDVRFAWRSFRRTPLVALTIVATVGLGLGLVTAVFTVLNLYVFRVDAVHRPHELFAVERDRSASAEPARFTRLEYETFLRETAVFSDAFAQTSDFDAWIEGRRMEGALVTGNFFHVLGVGAARGRVLTPDDDQPGGPAVMVLSHRAWARQFASDPGVLGRTVRVNDAPFRVVGVMPDGFRGLTVAPLDFWAPLAIAAPFRLAHDGRDAADHLDIVGRLAPGVAEGQAEAQVQAWDIRRAAARGAERPATRLTLEPRLGTVSQPAEVLLVFAPLFFAFGLVLLIGCANVANLLFGRAVARQREIGIRLAIGASRRRIIWQLLAESLLLAVVAAAIGFGVSRLALAAVVYAVTNTFPPELGDIRIDAPAADWRVALFLAGGAIVSTLFFALAPALQSTRLDLVRAIRGEVVRSARPGRARDALIALQVAGSALLLISAAVFLRSSWAAATVDPGIRTSDTLNVAVLDENRRAAVLDVVRRDPGVVSMAASWPGGPLGGRAAAAEGLARTTN
jgi:predicted permease